MSDQIKLNIYQKLLAIQSELKAPKNQRNNFGKYNYRSCEDILEAVKPLLKILTPVIQTSFETSASEKLINLNSFADPRKGPAGKGIFVPAFIDPSNELFLYV